MKYGWVSQKALKNNRVSHIYKTPSGESIQVTSVNYSNTQPGSSFGDEVCIGEVTSWEKNVVNNNVAPEHYYEYLYDFHTGQYEYVLRWR